MYFIVILDYYCGFCFIVFSNCCWNFGLPQIECRSTFSSLLQCLFDCLDAKYNLLDTRSLCGHVIAFWDFAVRVLSLRTRVGYHLGFTDTGAKTIKKKKKQQQTTKMKVDNIKEQLFSPFLIMLCLACF